MAYVSRDPFGRTELHRKAVHVRKPITEAPVTGCAWCGSLNGRGNLYRYRTESDGGRTFEDSRLFCSVGCRRLYALRSMEE